MPLLTSNGRAALIAKIQQACLHRGLYYGSMRLFESKPYFPVVEVYGDGYNLRAVFWIDKTHKLYIETNVIKCNQMYKDFRADMKMRKVEPKEWYVV